MIMPLLLVLLWVVIIALGVVGFAWPTRKDAR